MASKADVTLYWATGSVPSMSVMIALEEKGISYSGKELDLDIVATDKMVKKLNPRKQVPILQHGHLVLSESVAACLYLEKAFFGKPMMPTDALQEAVVIQRMLQAQKIGLPKQTTICCLWDDEEEEEQVLPDEEEELENDRKNVATELRIWESYIKQQGKGTFIAGSEFTMADAMFFPVLAFAVWMGLEPQRKYPNLGEYYEMVKERRSVQAVWPSLWNEPHEEELMAEL